MNPNNNLKQSKQKAHKALRTQKNTRLKLEPKFDKPRANASRLTRNFVDENPKYNHKEVKAYLKNTLVNSRPIRGATYGAQSSSVAHLQSAGTIPANSTGNGALLFTNNPYYPVSYLQQTSSGTLEENSLKAQTAFSSGNSYISYESYAVEVNGVRGPIQMYEMKDGAYLTGLWVNKDATTVKDGSIAYAGNYSNFAGTITSTDPTGVAVQVRIAYWPTLDGPVTILTTMSFTVSSTPGSGNWNYVHANSATGYYAVQFRRSVSGTTDLKLPMTFLTLTTAASYRWAQVPIIDSAENTLLREWVDSCKQIRVPAADLLVSNFNAEIYKNGKIAAVFVPPDEICGIPMTPEECYNYITVAPQKVQKAVNMPLSEGLHVPWIGFDMNAFEFRHNMRGVMNEFSISRLSGWLVAWRCNSAEEMTQPMDLFLNMSLEGITKQTILPALPCPHVLQLWNEWNNFRAHHTLISENPKHLKKAARLVGNFLKDKNNQEMLLKAGLALASTLVTLL